MGNLKNRGKRNKRKAANWRGIIKMRKSKKVNLKTSETTSSKVKIDNATLENYDQAQEPNELENTENLQSTPNNSSNDDSQQIDENEFIILEAGISQQQCINEHNYCTCLDDSKKQYQFETNRKTDDSAEFGIIEEVIDLEETGNSTFDFDKWIEVDDDYYKSQVMNKNEANFSIINECEDQVHLNNTGHNECEILDNPELIGSVIVDVENAGSISSLEFDKWIEVDECSGLDKDECEPTSGSAAENIDKNLIDRNESPNLDDDNYTTEHQMRDNAANIAFKVTGRRIVDMNLLFNQIKCLNRHSDECNFNDMEVIDETKMGLRAIFEFRCRVCGFEQKVTTSERNMEGINVNKGAVLGITSIGSGFYNLEEFCTHLKIPCMSDKTFQKNNKDLQKDWWELAMYHTDEALKEEIRLAIAAGDVDSKGNALIIVITDGSWGKRSYGKGYSSLSGCAVLIGCQTKKIIYIGVKNKYCQTCANSYAIMCPPNDHPCNINYEGASSGMETAIVVEGFKHCATLGARFPILVADGDASTFKELRELRLYKDPVIIIQKYECVNHLYKNFRKKFKAMGFNTKYTPRNRKYMTPSKGNEICLGIRMASKHWRESNVDQSEKFSRLEKDCMNAPLHYFGQHDNCDSYFCQKTTTPESVELINLLKTDKIFQAILGLCQDYFASNVKSLLADYNTNAAEGFNSIVAKFLGGKRINYSLAGSYKGRIGNAAVQYNTDYHSGSEFHKVNFESPDLCEKMENRRKRKLKANAVSLQKKPRRKPTYDNEASQVGYGEGCQSADKTGRAFDLAVESELAKLEENREERESILKDTEDRENCTKWHEVRQNIINSFYFPRIVNANNPKSYTNLTFEMLYNSKEFAKTAERKHYKLYEEEALNVFSSLYNDHNLQKCGIFVDKDLCFLGSTPLRLYGPESIVAIRCPLKAYNKSIDEAIDSKAINFWKRKPGNEELFVNVKSAWYLEIQGELHVSDRKFAYLVVWLGEKKFKIEKVERDDELWDSRMKPKLTFFFNQSMVKELADSRRDRKMKLRVFDPEQNTFV